MCTLAYASFLSVIYFVCFAFQVNYPMTKPCRGRALIINNEYFVDPKLGSRDGAQYDVLNLCELLKGLHFKTILKDNVSARVCMLHHTRGCISLCASHVYTRLKANDLNMDK